MSKYVCVAGNMASGKTTLVELLSREGRWSPIYEDLGSHPYIDDFYAEPDKWAFHNQLYFLIEALRVQKAISQNGGGGKSTCQDFSIYERQLYTELLFERGQIDQRDYETCSDLFRLIIEAATEPHCIVYLRTSPQFIMERLKLRGRRSESGVTFELIEQLTAKYDDWFLNRIKSNILVIDSDRFDPRDGAKLVPLADHYESHSSKALDKRY